MKFSFHSPVLLSQQKIFTLKRFFNLPMAKTWSAFFFISILSGISLQGVAQDAVINDANVEKRMLSGSFTAIKVSSGIDLYLSQGNEESIAVSASDPKYMNRLKTEVENGTLKIYYDNNGVMWNNNEKRRLKAYVSFKILERLIGSSGADVQVKGKLDMAILAMDFSSGATFNGDVNIAEVTVEQSSGAEINVTGKAEKLKVELNSGAIFKGFDLTVEYCDAKASSGGGIRVNVNKELNAKASSGGGIKYKGAGVIKDLSVSSGGNVKRA
jgi:hypothetical protein